MSNAYILDVGENFSQDENENISTSLFKEYERVIVESIITSFGLDFIVNDRHGGDVDTIHNVRQIGTDKDMLYKNVQNKNYADSEIGKYDSSAYHSDSSYRNKGKQDKKSQKEGNLQDVYRGTTMGETENRQLDHIISASEIHSDRGRALAEISGVTLASDDSNFQSTNGYINNIKSNHSAKDFVEKVLPEKIETLKDTIEKGKAKLQSMSVNTPEERHKKEVLEAKVRKSEEGLEVLESVDKKAVLKADKKARAEYEKKLAREYYTSPKFIKDTAKAAGMVGLAMGARQALGLIFTEIWFSVKEEFNKLTGDFNLKEFLNSLGNGVKNGFEKAKLKYRELISKFFSGAMSGMLSSLTTTLCNIFFTTAKNIVRVIRQTYASLVEAFKILFFNPNGLIFGERIRAVAKIIATGASVVVGTIVSDTIAKTPLVQIPAVGEIIPVFTGSFITGIMTCTLLHYFDKSESFNALVKWLNKFPTIDAEVEYFRNQAKLFEKYAAELMKIDLAQFQKEATLYIRIANNLDNVNSIQEVNSSLKNIYKDMGINIPWEEDFDSFMSNKSNVLRFS